MAGVASLTKKAVRIPTSSRSTSSCLGASDNGGLSQQIETRNARRYPRGYGPGRHRLNTYAPGGEFLRQIADEGFQCRLDRPHHCVLTHGPFGAVKAHCNQASTGTHQRLGKPRHAHEEVAGQIDYPLEVIKPAVDHALMQNALMQAILWG